jgi:hypothetical protein
MNPSCRNINAIANSPCTFFLCRLPYPVKDSRPEELPVLTGDPGTDSELIRLIFTPDDCLLTELAEKYSYIIPVSYLATRHTNPYSTERLWNITSVAATKVWPLLKSPVLVEPMLKVVRILARQRCKITFPGFFLFATVSCEVGRG